ncbi:MAG: ABC transporter permease [Desulfurococcales archaeon]|nr:ABC transporter permease [Desulfurococcales archaeon]
MAVRSTAWMRFRLRLEEWKESFLLTLRPWAGKIGWALLIIQLVLALYALAAYYPQGMRHYQAGFDWFYKYPVHVPPCWAVKKKAQPVRLSLQNVKPVVKTKTMNISYGNIRYVFKYYTLSYNKSFIYKGDALPSDSAMLLGLTIPGGKKILQAKIHIDLLRPDGTDFVFLDQTIPVSQYGNKSVITIRIGGATFNKTLIIHGRPVQVPVKMPYPISKYPIVATGPLSLGQIAQTLGKSMEKVFGTNPFKTDRPVPAGQALFAEVTPNGTVVPLKGRYTFRLSLMYLINETAMTPAQAREIESRGSLNFYFIAYPNCYGLAGTDTLARPVGLGLLLGLPYAFLLGFLVTFTSTFIGAIYGSFAGYWKDIRGEVMMRIADIFLSLPFLPILIVISYVYKVTMLSLAGLMILLFWAGPVIVVRSMALQISEQVYVEAAKAVGAKTSRIVFRHVFPQVFPYTLAIAVLSIPGIIVAEASLSLLGLGDPTAPTWGKLLQLAYDEHAVQNGWWWMYIFPGLALVIFSATFLLIGRAVEPLVAPKLQR